MGFMQRLFKTASVRRIEDVSDGYGGLKPSECEVVPLYKFHYFNMTPWDREAMITKYGAESGAVMLKGTGEYSSELQELDILQVSASERYRVMSIMSMQGRSATPHHVSLVLMEADTEE